MKRPSLIKPSKLITKNLIRKIRLSIIIAIVSTGISAIAASETGLNSKLKYDSASHFSHLNWLPDPSSPIAVRILSLHNYSGIPMESRQEDSDYYEHGKIPKEIETLFSNLVDSSRYFSAHDMQERELTDFHFQLSIDRYELPFDYAPDDNWWNEVNDDMNRWLSMPRSAKLRLTLKINSNNRNIASWSHSVETIMSECDLNQLPQPFTKKNILNNTILEFSQTTPGQAFIASSNFLILEGINYVSNLPRLASVVRKQDNELLIVAEQATFLPGEKLNLFFKNSYAAQSALPAGQIEIIKAYQNQAVAYPVNLRADQIKVGDWVEVGKIHPFENPKSIFRAKNQCADVKVALN